eukprot:2533043-Alexandrium_andersonii.AAC.1
MPKSTRVSKSGPGRDNQFGSLPCGALAMRMADRCHEGSRDVAALIEQPLRVTTRRVQHALSSF